MQDRRIADGEPDAAATRSAVPDEWLRRQVRRLLDQVGAMPSPAFLRRERAVGSSAARRPIGRGVSPDRTVQAVAAVVFFLLVLCLALTTWQWRAARTAELAAQARAQRTAATRDFVTQLLRTAAGSSSSDPEGRPRMKDVLDAATPRIVQQFADDPIGQGELLGSVAAMYRDLGDHDSGRALLALQRIALRRVYGESHPVLIRSLLDEAQWEIARGQPDAAGARLAEADPLLSRMGPQGDALRGRWWMLLSETQPGTVAGAEALDRAIEAFERQRPVDGRLGDALAHKAWRLLPTDPAQAQRLFERAATMVDDGAGTRRRNALTGLVQAHEAQGDYEAALAARDQARALGSREPLNEAQFAWALHREGQRERALDAFEALMRQFGSTDAASPGPAEAVARAYYAECLAAEGRPMQAIPLLEAVSAGADHGAVDASGPRRALLALGDAYDRAGLWSKARDTIKASLDRRLLPAAPAPADVGEARERWGRFLLGRGDVEGAQTQFDLVLEQAGERNLERVVLAFGGLARVAMARHDWDAALTASTHAVVGFENVVGARDVRTGPYLWLIHAEALRHVDDYASARIWATRALDASRRYDAPGAPSIREAESVMARLLG